MNILVFSDSHGHGDRIEEVLRRQIVPPDAVFFLGDGLRDIAWIIPPDDAPLYSVRGNCDFYSSRDAEDEILINIDGIRIFAAHGHRYSVKSGYEVMAAKAATLGADIMLFGHTHEPLSETLQEGDSVGGITLTKTLHILNPGSIGSYGDATFGTVTVRRGVILTAVAEF